MLHLRTSKRLAARQLRRVLPLRGALVTSAAVHKKTAKAEALSVLALNEDPKESGLRREMTLPGSVRSAMLAAGSDGAQARYIGQSSQRALLQQACAVVPTTHKERDNTGSYASAWKRTDDAHCIHPRQLHRRLSTRSCVDTGAHNNLGEYAVKRESHPDAALHAPPP